MMQLERQPLCASHAVLSAGGPLTTDVCVRH